MGKKRSRKRRNGMDYLVFVSHAGYDKWIASVLCEKIESLGAKTFRDDRDIAGGDSFPDEIRRAIRRCHEVVVLLTPISVSRQWVLTEIGMGLMAQRRIVPLMYHIGPEQIPGAIDKRVGFSLDKLDSYLADFLKRVRDYEN